MRLKKGCESTFRSLLTSRYQTPHMASGGAPGRTATRWKGGAGPWKLASGPRSPRSHGGVVASCNKEEKIFKEL